MRALLISLILALGFSAGVTGQEIHVILEADGKNVAEFDVSLTQDEAIARVGETVEKFDLKNMRWEHEASKQWVTLAMCEDWSKKSLALANKSEKRDELPPKFVEFLEWSLDPKFKVEEKDGVITMISGQVDYTIKVEKKEYELTPLFKYSKLNAYKKAMTQRKMAPYAELKVMEELQRRNVMPVEMEIKITGIPEAPLMKTIFKDKESGLEK